MRKMLHVMSLVIGGSLLFTSSAFADGFWTRQELSQSSWNSHYTTVDGNQVRAHLKFNGPNGTYDTEFGQGQLFNIQYGVDTNSMPGRPFFQITGGWSFLGQTGRFTLASEGRDRFKGSWQGNNGGGRWTGSSMFGMWKTDPNNNRMYCEYRYPALNNPAQINVQLVIWYPQDPDRTGYYYFANRENQIWGRCVCSKNPTYDPNSMQWSKLIDNSWEELPQGETPAPKDGDPDMAAIDKIPDPPV